MSTSIFFRRRPTRLRPTDGTKNASKTSVNGQPPEPKVSVPTPKAAIAPLRSSARARQAAAATIAANAAPTSSA
jgi:hypothetical protein